MLTRQNLCSDVVIGGHQISRGNGPMALRGYAGQGDLVFRARMFGMGSTTVARSVLGVGS